MDKKRTHQVILSFFFMFTLLFWGGFQPSRAQEDAELQALLSKLTDRFGVIKTFKADYLRELLPKVSSVLPSASLKAEGQLTFASPDKLRLDQRKPRTELLVSNGDKAWWYIPGEKTVQIFQVKEYGQQVKPITEFFSGLGGLEKHFTIRQDKTIPEEAPFYALVLQPKTPQPDLNQIHLRISKTTLLPLEFTMFNLLGDGTRFRFSQVQTGVKVAESAFQFTPPKGVTIVNPSVNLPKNRD
jgi:outer membrane lipoprotein carrier protein